MSSTPSSSKMPSRSGDDKPDSYLYTTRFHFRDKHGRALLLRGVNFCSSAKAPHGQPSWSSKGFWEEAEAGRGDFVGRPLDLDDGSADVHLARLRSWGYNFLRYVFTWEALEHEGPGRYDREYMDYVVKVLKKCKEWGFRVFMDPHQDVWSRFSGGSGAPLWTLYACGIDPQGITPTYSALLQHEWPPNEDPDPAAFPQMLWATNYPRLLSLTVWTLFFAGKVFAPKCIIDGVNIQDWLQDHYFDAVAELVKRVGQEPGLLDEVVIGWDSMNEPGDGMLGRDDLSVVPKDERLKKGPMPSPFQGMKLGMGQAVEVDVWDFTQMGPKLSGKKMIDPKGVKLWLSPEDEATRGGGKWGWKRDPEWKLGTCIWALHGVWEPSTSALLKRDYFLNYPGDPSRPADFVNDFWRMHFLAYASRIRLHHPDAILFVQPPIFAIPPDIPESFLNGRACTSPHYYDGLTLMTKHWNWFNADALGTIRKKYWSVLQAVRVGEPAIRKSVQDQLGVLKSDTKELGEYPTLIGEIGCPFDMDDKKAYGYVDGGKGEGDYSAQQKAWDCSLNAADGPNCLNYTLWTYCPDNSHEWGDNWNNEDLSIWSPDDIKFDETNDDAENDKDINTVSTRLVSADNSTQPSPTSTMSRSFASTATSATLTPSYRPPLRLSASGVESGEGITASLLLDGCRAPAATCRPFPIKTVGTPERMDFDIASTKFTYSVRVSSGDTSTDDIATEVYIPFIHYAGELHKDDNITASPASSLNNSSADLIQQADKQFDGSTSDNGPTRSIGPLHLDLDVKLSKGTYFVRGQTLTWKYPVPKRGDEVYTIEVTRRGGAIVRDTGYVDSQEGWGQTCPTCVIA